MDRFITDPAGMRPCGADDARRLAPNRGRRVRVGGRLMTIDYYDQASTPLGPQYFVGLNPLVAGLTRMPDAADGWAVAALARYFPDLPPITAAEPSADGSQTAGN